MRIRRTRALLAAAVAAALVVVGCGQGNGGSGDVAKIAQYTKSDRSQKLVAGAKKEKKLVWYTTVIPSQIAQPLADAFHSKYPYIKVQLYRGNSGEVTQKMIQEYRAHSYRVDLVDGTSTASMLRDTGFLQPFRSPQLDRYPAQFKDKNGYWGTELLYYMVLAYNKRLVSPKDVPHTYQDLLNPKLRGKMAWSTSSGSGAPTFVGNVLMTMGQTKGMAYLRKLAKQQIHNVNSSGRSVLDQIVAGQFPIAIEVFNDQVEFSKSSGAPVDWQPLQPVCGQLSRISLAKRAPDPNSAMLFLDFVFSKQGQQVIRKRGGIPADPGVNALKPSLKPSASTFRANYIQDEAAKKLDSWNKTYQQLFVQGG